MVAGGHRGSNAHREPAAIITAMEEGSEPVPELVFFPNGIVKMKGFRLGGAMHGEWEWYRTDGTVMRTGQFDRGRQIGTWRTFDRSGRLVKETDYSKRS